MICKKCNLDLKENYFETFIDNKRRFHRRAVCCYCRSEYWKEYNKRKKELKIKRNKNIEFRKKVSLGLKGNDNRWKNNRKKVLKEMITDA